jgi:hypothetical protein
MPNNQDFNRKDADSKEKGREMGGSSTGAKNQNWQDNKNQPKTGEKQDNLHGNRDKNAGKDMGGKNYPQDNR